MPNKHVVILGKGYTAGTIKVLDTNTDGSLLIRHSVTQAWAESITDDTMDPLVELANELTDKLDKGKLSLTLIGNDNLITFKDDDAPILEGGLTLRNVKLNCPYLNNSELFDVNLANSLNVTIHSSKVDQLFLETLEPIHMTCCYVDDKFGLETVTRLPLQFLMNKHVGQ
jgi:hypothetical protein